MPGDLLKLNFVFKSDKGGVYTEKWEFLTRPKLLSGASLILTLRGIAVQEDKYRKIRAGIEVSIQPVTLFFVALNIRIGLFFPWLKQNLLNKQSELIAVEMLDLILAGVRTPERSPTPEDAYITDEEVFSRLNPTVHLFLLLNSRNSFQKLKNNLF
jgi:hypothetical protein